ncbi:MAG TPA: site-specific integrase [Guyparkeria sp.]|nr:site-specific integrase [Guyparkeria sp.]
MATFKHLPSGKWSARIRKRGYYVSRSFSTKGAAQRWARRVEDEIDADEFDGKKEGETIGDLLKRYHHEVTPGKKGSERESRRIDQLLAHPVSKHLAVEFGPRHAREYRDSRLEDTVKKGHGIGEKKVSPNTVKKELHLLSAVFKHAIREWEMDLVNPIPNIKMPKVPDNSRDRRLTWVELLRILRAAKRYSNSEFQDIVRIAYLTAMREGEILGINWEDVDLDRAIVVLRITKNNEQRVVPLDPRVVRLLERRLPADRRQKPMGRIFRYTPDGFRSIWQTVIRVGLQLSDLKFHDLRHEAASRFSEMGIFSDMEISSITGHKSYKSLKRYTHHKSSRLAQKIAGRGRRNGNS